jgi:hypothetical protein
MKNKIILGMKKGEWFILLVVFLVCGIVACSNNIESQALTKSKKFSVTELEVEQLLKLFDVQLDSESNFHIFYSEYLNDSSAILRVYLSNHLANEKLGVCDAFRFEQSHIFLYDSINCKVDMPDSLTTSNTNAPFMNDGLFWQVLAKRRGGNMQYFRISFFESYDDEESLDFEYDPMR